MASDSARGGASLLLITMENKKAAREHLEAVALADTTGAATRFVKWNKKFNSAFTGITVEDTTAILRELSRSNAAALPSNHAAWKRVTSVVGKVQQWMQGHNSWKEAYGQGNAKMLMPFIPTTRALAALRYLDLKSDALPSTLVEEFGKIKLKSHIEGHDNLDAWWSGASLNDDTWRGTHMKSPGRSNATLAIDFERFFKATRICLTGVVVEGHQTGLPQKPPADHTPNRNGSHRASTSAAGPKPTSDQHESGFLSDLDDFIPKQEPRPVFDSESDTESLSGDRAKNTKQSNLNSWTWEFETSSPRPMGRYSMQSNEHEQGRSRSMFRENLAHGEWYGGKRGASNADGMYGGKRPRTSEEFPPPPNSTPRLAEQTNFGGEFGLDIDSRGGFPMAIDRVRSDITKLYADYRLYQAGYRSQLVALKDQQAALRNQQVALNEQFTASKAQHDITKRQHEAAIRSLQTTLALLEGKLDVTRPKGSKTNATSGAARGASLFSDSEPDGV